MKCSRDIAFLASATIVGGAIGCENVLGLEQVEMVLEGTGGAATTSTGGAAGATGCVSPGDCTGLDTTCRSRTCSDGTCGWANAEQNTACTEDGGDACDGQGSCKKALGTACSASEQCLSEHCTDTVCCATACDASPCEQCDLGVSLGSCDVSVEGTDPHGACPGTCGAQGECAGQVAWALHFGDADSHYQYTQAVAVHVSGDVAIAGVFDGFVQFGPDQYLGNGQKDIFLAKYDGNGNYQWSHAYGDNREQVVRAVAVDGSGNISIAGDFQGTLNFGGADLTAGGPSGRDLFVARFGADGNHLWSKRFGDSQMPEVDAMAVDPGGGLVISGRFDGQLDFGAGPINSVGSADLFAAKLDSDGNGVWNLGLGNALVNLCEQPCLEGCYGCSAALAVGADASVVLAGGVNGQVDFGVACPTITSSGGLDVFLAKLSPAGACLWAKAFGSGQFLEMARGVAVDAEENVIVVGWFSDMVNLGGGLLTGSGDQNIFVAKYTAEGEHLWSKAYQQQGSASASAVAVDAQGNVLVTGWYKFGVAFGGDQPIVDPSGDAQGFLLKLTGQDGSHLWSRGFKTAASSGEGKTLATWPNDDVAIGGWAYHGYDFGPAGQYQGTYDADAFLVRLMRPN